MIFKIKHANNYLLIFFFFILLGCKLQEPTKNHGIIFLENRYKTLIVNKSNKNDVIKKVGKPHTTMFNDESKWVYIERTISRGKMHKLGQNVLKTNNVMLLEFNKYGVLKDKVFLSKDNINKLKFNKNETENNLSQKSFVQKFLQSLKQKMYGNK